MLILSVERRIRFKPGSLPSVELPSGCYVYVGSAKGPGGFEKRISRHLKKIKKAKWHIDYLTRKKGVRVEGVFYTLPKYSESMLTNFLSSLGFRAMIKGFGATDCPRDFSHLLSSGEDAKRTVERISSAMKKRRLHFTFFEKDYLSRFH
ncbi:MAG: GIY-YIG nuclease family protein [Crenarchaeota archaeon]|nr:GIY-YIG nuclease family protein [Thermoproteota archaeon]MDW8033681.1 GIY-YIG nuclease family protein [Nitrososphaerota archaeon]